MDNEIVAISNGLVAVKVNLKGASLMSVCELCRNDGEGDTEYLWQGDPKYWKGRAPNLFPYIGRLTDGKYMLEENTYGMEIHGFAKDSQFEVIDLQKDAVSLCLKDNESTYLQFPYRFQLEITYKLNGKRLDVTFFVKNKDEKVMYFGIGGHPGFNVPIETGLNFNDYFLEFTNNCQPKRIHFSSDGFVEGEPIEFQLKEERILPLRHELFDHDAIVLVDMDRQVTLKTQKGSKAVRVTYPDMKYIGFWHRPHTDAPYVCIEPWSSLPSRKGVVENLAEQPSLLKLEPGEEYTNSWSIEIL